MARQRRASQFARVRCCELSKLDVPSRGIAIAACEYNEQFAAMSIRLRRTNANVTICDLDHSLKIVHVSSPRFLLKNSLYELILTVFCYITI